MEKPRREDENNLSTLVQDARGLIAATADVTCDKVIEARKRPAAALDNGKELIGRVRERTAEHAAAAEGLVRENPKSHFGLNPHINPIGRTCPSW
jgi:ElaB/YqjD/DUF883 family membrane-anchored ribosome-binding protein